MIVTIEGPDPHYPPQRMTLTQRVDDVDGLHKILCIFRCGLYSWRTRSLFEALERLIPGESIDLGNGHVTLRREE